jgi:rhamnosyltransferase
MKILVILASYNGGKYIKHQIDSILNQESVSLDIMVFDDSSKDNTIKVLSNYSLNSKVIVHEREIGSGSAANNFFNAIKGISDEVINKYNFVAFSDQDDIWLPNKLNEACKILKKESSSLYFSNLILWDEKTDNESIINKSYPQKKYDYLFEGGSAGCTYVLTNNLCLDLKNLLVQRKFVHWQYFSHDWFVYFYARVNQYKVSIDNKAYIRYRIHSENVHGQLNKNSLSAIIERLKLVKEGWYFKHIKGFSEFTPKGSTAYNIYQLYYKNYFSRLYVLLKYNFKLMRSSKKFIQFFIISLIPLKINK